MRDEIFDLMTSRLATAGLDRAAGAKEPRLSSFGFAGAAVDPTAEVEAAPLSTESTPISTRSGWENHLLHVTVSDRRHRMMEPA